MLLLRFEEVIAQGPKVSQEIGLMIFGLLFYTLNAKPLVPMQWFPSANGYHANVLAITSDSPRR